ncbi:MAG: bifunctional diaminohydroxyphosphoribosylaminopyrimidine deaminase/5-amino-6-(5-phosphoribosylamino)uracil reductase RibD [Cytophagales bacterium]|nr:MAG: bifunctional diaminohydroxyphosphoribosylaminopyrimidine deaminase/5-amino-6-(5-phosphoribosylamino)uracil reductase RibD [Cytophagales bacterium]
MEKDILYMNRALELALSGRGLVSPNPMVGCVIVHEDKIIGEGYHKRFGEPHAEVNAINAVADKELLKEATLYVNLEPCSHFGKTPPCADFIIRHQLKKVVVANLDTNPLVAGKGIQKLRNAGIEVQVGVQEKEGKNLNKRFFTFVQRMRPFIVLKWAETADGFVAHENYDSKWISNSLSRKLVHKWRSEEDAVMIGTNTAFYDNPILNVRDWVGRNPVRVVIDKDLRLPITLHLFDHSQPTICYNTLKDNVTPNLEYIKIKDGKSESYRFLPQVIENLHAKRFQSVMVEGGSGIINSLLADDLWDEIRVFRSAICFGKGIKAPQIRGVLFDKEHLQGDDLLIYRREDSL